MVLVSNVSQWIHASESTTTGRPSTSVRYSSAMWWNRCPGYEKYWPTSTWSPARNDTVNAPLAIMRG